MMHFIVALLIVVHGLYAFGLYIINRKQKQRELIYFGLLLIFAAFSTLVDDDKLLISALPIDATLSLKLLYLSFAGDRKSTRLNSSHVAISYAVFCLKKKT